MSGDTTTTVPIYAISDEVVVNRGGNTGRQATSAVAAQLASEGAVADAIAAAGAATAILSGRVTAAEGGQAALAGSLAGLSGQVAALAATITTNGIVAETHAALVTLAGTIDGQGAEVLDTDTGSSPLATATGYDGASTPNAGRYRWVEAWARWLWIGPTGLGGALRIDAIPDHAAQIADAQVAIGRGLVLMDTPGIALAVGDPETGASSPHLLLNRGDLGLHVDALRDIWDRFVDLGLPSSAPPRLVDVDGTWPHPSGDRVPAEADMGLIAGYGSSTMAGLATPLAAMAASFGVGYFNGGRGGEYWQQIFARLGSYPMTFDAFTLPSSGTVTVEASTGPGFAGVGPTLEGYLPVGELRYPVTLGWDTDTSARTITRIGAGSAVPIPAGTPFIPAVVAAHRTSILILNAGKNNLTSSSTPEQIAEGNWITARWAAPLFPRHVVIDQFPNRGYGPGVWQYDTIIGVNDLEASRYGKLHIPTLPWMLSGQAFDDLALTPTSADLEDLAEGRVPYSYYQDGQHLNATVRSGIVTHLVQPKLTTELRWYQEIAA